jgi:hypothetical protein
MRIRFTGDHLDSNSHDFADGGEAWKRESTILR